MADTPILHKLTVLEQNLRQLPMALFFVNASTEPKRLSEDFAFLRDADLEQASGTLLRWELEQYCIFCDIERLHILTRLLKNKLISFRETRNEVAKYEEPYMRKLQETPYYQASINVKSKADFEYAEPLKDEKHEILRDNIQAIGVARNMLDGWIGAIQNNLSLIEPEQQSTAILHQPATTETTQDRINAHMSRLAQKQAYGLPEWDLLKTVVEEVKSQYSPDKSKYVAKLYYAIKDLFTLDYHAVCEVIGIDEEARSITSVWSRYYANRVGPPEKEPPFTQTVSEELFNSDYAGKSLEQLNQNPLSIKSIKLNKYAKERSLEKPLEDEEDGSYNFIHWVMDGENATKQKIDNLFKPVIDSGWNSVTFEQFVEQYKPTPTTLTPPAPTTSTSPASDKQINIFNSMPLDEVRRWFMQLADNNSTNGKPFLTPEQVEQFIERAFLGHTNIPDLTFNVADGERTSITKLFYLFYQRCTNDYAIEPTKHCKEKYVRLLTDHFTNYKYKTVFSTFNNSKNAPKQWQ